jgi:hypothetical protein
MNLRSTVKLSYPRLDLSAASPSPVRVATSRRSDPGASPPRGADVTASRERNGVAVTDDRVEGPPFSPPTAPSTRRVSSIRTGREKRGVAWTAERVEGPSSTSPQARLPRRQGAPGGVDYTGQPAAGGRSSQRSLLEVSEAAAAPPGTVNLRSTGKLRSPRLDRSAASPLPVRVAASRRGDHAASLPRPTFGPAEPRAQDPRPTQTAPDLRARATDPPIADPVFARLFGRSRVTATLSVALCLPPGGAAELFAPTDPTEGGGTRAERPLVRRARRSSGYRTLRWSAWCEV